MGVLLGWLAALRRPPPVATPPVIEFADAPARSRGRRDAAARARDHGRRRVRRGAVPLTLDGAAGAPTAGCPEPHLCGPPAGVPATAARGDARVWAALGRRERDGRARCRGGARGQVWAAAGQLVTEPHRRQRRDQSAALLPVRHPLPAAMGSHLSPGRGVPRGQAPTRLPLPPPTGLLHCGQCPVAHDGSPVCLKGDGRSAHTRVCASWGATRKGPATGRMRLMPFTLDPTRWAVHWLCKQAARLTRCRAALRDWLMVACVDAGYVVGMPVVVCLFPWPTWLARRRWTRRCGAREATRRCASLRSATHR